MSEGTYWPEPGEPCEPDTAVHALRELHADGGPHDFEQAMSLVMALDTHLTDGGKLPEDWAKATRD